MTSTTGRVDVSFFFRITQFFCVCDMFGSVNGQGVDPGYCGAVMVSGHLHGLARL